MAQNSEVLTSPLNLNFCSPTYHFPLLCLLKDLSVILLQERIDFFRLLLLFDFFSFSPENRTSSVTSSMLFPRGENKVQIRVLGI